MESDVIFQDKRNGACCGFSHAFPDGNVTEIAADNGFLPLELVALEHAVYFGIHGEGFAVDAGHASGRLEVGFGGDEFVPAVATGIEIDDVGCIGKSRRSRRNQRT